MSIYRTHVILFLISRCYGHNKFASFGSSEYTELSYIKINEKKGAHGISCDCWADSGTPPVCDLITPNPQDFRFFLLRIKKDWRLGIRALPCLSIAFVESIKSITIGEYDQSSPWLPYCCHTTNPSVRYPKTPVSVCPWRVGKMSPDIIRPRFSMKK